MRTRIGKYAIGALLGLALLACARGGDGMPAGEEHFPAGRTHLHVSLNLSGEARSKAANPDTPEVEGRNWENAIRTLSVFVRNKYGDEWVWDTLFRLYDVQKDNEVTLDKPLTEETRLYAAANLTPAQEEALKQQVEDENAEAAVYNLTQNNFRLVEDFAPYSTWEAETGTAARGDIAMCCTEVATAKRGEEDNHFSVVFNLKRLVAKVLVTVKEDPEVKGGAFGVKYAPITSADDSHFKGWIRLDSIRYVLDGLNRKAYIKQRIDDTKEDTDANVIDPNNNLNDFPTEESTITDFYSFPLGGANQAEGYAEVLAFEAESYISVIAYGEERLEENSGNSYYEGIYCPENTFAPEYHEDGQWMMITHVVISAEFTPKDLQVEYGLFDYIKNEAHWLLPEEKAAVENLRPEGEHEATNVVEVICPDEATARLLLTESLRQGGLLLGIEDQADVERYFKEASYFYHEEEKQFFTYGAAMIQLGKEHLGLDDLKELGNYVPYNGGRGYYYTYIDNRHPDKKDSFAFYKHGQVERNRYYILTITGFSSPGASFTDPDYIEVHTRKLAWKDGGNGEVLLDEVTNITN